MDTVCSWFPRPYCFAGKAPFRRERYTPEELEKLEKDEDLGPEDVEPPLEEE